MSETQLTTQPPPVASETTERIGFLALVREHKGLVALLLVGAALRITALVAIYPGIWFSDSNVYVRTAATGVLSPIRVTAYSLFVAPFWHLGSAGALIITQHLVGLALGVLVYALLRRRGAPLPLALLGATPLVLDAYLIDIEHTIMSETVFHTALLGGIALLLWSERLRLPAAAGAGLLLGFAGVTRSVAVPFIAVLVLYLLVRRVGWKPIAVFCLGWAVVVAGYATIFMVQHGRFGFTEYGGRFLYSKVAPFANCAHLQNLPEDERRFCPDPRHRLSPNAYLWGRESPVYGVPVSQDAQIGDFAKRVIRSKPRTYGSLVVSGFLHYFEPGHRIGHDDYSDRPWHFPADPRHRQPYPGYRGPIEPGNGDRLLGPPSQYVSHFSGEPHFNVAASHFLHVYQRVVYTSGQLLAIFLGVVLVAFVLRRGAWRLRLDAAMLATLTLAALAMASVLSVFSYRYILTAVVLMPPAAALAGTALMGAPRRQPRSAAE